MRISKKTEDNKHLIGGLLEKGIDKGDKIGIAFFFNEKKIQWENIPRHTRIRNQIGFFFLKFKGLSKDFKNDYKNHLINEMAWELKGDKRAENIDIRQLKLALCDAFKDYNIIQMQNLYQAKRNAIHTKVISNAPGYPIPKEYI